MRNNIFVVFFFCTSDEIIFFFLLHYFFLFCFVQRTLISVSFEMHSFKMCAISFCVCRNVEKVNVLKTEEMTIEIDDGIFVNFFFLSFLSILVSFSFQSSSNKSTCLNEFFFFCFIKWIEMNGLWLTLLKAKEKQGDFLSNLNAIVLTESW